MSRKLDINDYISDEIFEAYCDSVKALGTTDIILYKKGDDLRASLREKFVAAYSASNPSAKIVQVLSQPPKKKPPHQVSFWFIVVEGEEVLFGALHGSLLSPGGES